MQPRRRLRWRLRGARGVDKHVGAAACRTNHLRLLSRPPLQESAPPVEESVATHFGG